MIGKEIPPLIPGRPLSRDLRTKFWRVLKDLAENSPVEPRDRHPDYFPLLSYQLAEELGWATSDKNSSYLTYAITDKGRSNLKEIMASPEKFGGSRS